MILFDNYHCKQYPQWKLLAVYPYPEYYYDDFLFTYTILSDIDDQIYGQYSLADIAISTGLVTSSNELKRLIKNDSIRALQWFGKVNVDKWHAPIPWEESEYEIRKGQRYLEIVIGVVEYGWLISE